MRFFLCLHNSLVIPRLLSPQLSSGASPPSPHSSCPASESPAVTDAAARSLISVLRSKTRRGFHIHSVASSDQPPPNEAFLVFCFFSFIYSHCGNEFSSPNYSGCRPGSRQGRGCMYTVNHIILTLRQRGILRHIWKQCFRLGMTDRQLPHLSWPVSSQFMGSKANPR